ncbi:MAG: hypothetical protein ACKV2T_36655 [Kofleriaceae bacterium]
MRQRRGGRATRSRWRGLALAVLAPAIVVGCTISTGDAQSDLSLRRGDRSVIELPPNSETYAYCEPYDPPAHAEGAIKISRGNRFDGASWLVWAVRDDVERGQVVTFPVTFTSSEPARGALVYVNDDEDDNEVASDQAGSEGTITFGELDCQGFVEFTIRASLASAVGGPPILVQGTFRAPVGDPPD